MKRSIRTALLALFVSLSSLPAYAIGKEDDIDTNRPSFMDSPLVVPKGSVQLENGGLYQHSRHGINYFDISETEIRVGLTPKTEFQMFVPNFVAIHTVHANTQTGVSDLQEIGIKRQIGTYFKDLNLSLIAGVTVPTGNKFISGTGVQPVIRIPFTKGLSKNWSLGGMQSILVLNSGQDTQYQNFVSLNRAFGPRTSAFIEYGGYYTHSAPTQNIFHSGAIKKLNKNNQIDIQFGFGLNKSAPAAFVGAGYSFRFDKIPLLN